VASLRETQQASSELDFALPGPLWREVLWECDASSHRFYPESAARTINDHIADDGYRSID
jgi:hypothetical protein